MSVGFAFEANIPGVLVKPLEIFAQKQINLTKIESRPTKRCLGEYLFFSLIYKEIATENLFKKP